MEKPKPQIKETCLFFMHHDLHNHLHNVQKSIPNNSVIAKIAMLINSKRPLSVSYFNISSEKSDEVLYLPVSKIPKGCREERDSYLFKEISEVFSSAKVGRLFRKVIEELGDKVLDKDLEEFVNAYKQEWESLYGETSFEIVKGEEVRKAYLFENYCDLARKKYGSLGSSCMADREKQSLLEIYVNNPDVCQLIVRRDKSGKVTSRALLWNLTNGEYYMDRVYYTHDYQDQMFKSWFKKNYKNHNGLELKMHYKGSHFRNISVKLKNWKYRTYPYMDTFGYIDWKEGLLLVNPPKEYDYPSFGYPVLTITQTSGDPISYNFRWSEYENRWVNRQNSFYDEERGSYRTKIKYRTIKKYLPFLRGEFED